MPRTVQIYLPSAPSRILGHRDVLNALTNWNALFFAEEIKTIEIIVPSRAFLRPAAIATLTAWLLEAQTHGKRVYLSGGHNQLNYLARMDVFRVLNLPYAEYFDRHPEGGRFVPVQLIDNPQAVQRAVNAVCDMVLHQFAEAHLFLPALEWALAEIVDNVRLHADTTLPGVLAAQYYPHESRLRLCVADRGIGIRQSLQARYPVGNDSTAIRRAMERGVTRDDQVGQGNGLAGTLAIAQANGGTLEVFSGLASVQTWPDSKSGFRTHSTPSYQGTGVRLSLNTGAPVDLRQTFIQQPSYTYLEAESDRVLAAGGLKVRQAVAHCLSRETATPLRLKLQNLLSALPAGETLVLDFSGVKQVSSSFLDELLGRMVAEMGVANFKQQVALTGLSSDLQAMANVVIAQRMGQ